MPDIQNIPTTQYIGPRIIPHLWDPILWDATTQYDALAVVQYEGAYYVARYVPPLGNPPTNTTYWVKWADFNAQMAQLQQTVESFDNRITANANAIVDETTARQQADQQQKAAIASDLQTINATIASTEAGIRSDMEAADDALEATQLTSHKQLRDGYIVCIGDSWNAGVVDGNLSGYSVENGWGRKLCEFMRMDAATQLKNYAQPSAGFVATGGSNQRTFEDLLDLAVTSVGDTADKVTHLVVAGGVNDSNYVIAGSATVNEVQKAVTAFCNKAAIKFPHATIYVFPMLWSGHSEVRMEDIKVRNRIADGAHEASAPVSICRHTPEWLFGRAEYFGSQTQGHHTTLDGLQQVARYMAEWINGGDAHYNFWSNQRDTSKTNAMKFTSVETVIKNGMLRTHAVGKLNDSFDGNNVPLFSLPSGNTFFGGLQKNFAFAAISGHQAPVLISASGSDIQLQSGLASSPQSGQEIYFDFTIPFAF